ncbi:MAG: hypothetical protein ACBR15_08800 [Microcoleus sp.]
MLDRYCRAIGDRAMKIRSPWRIIFPSILKIRAEDGFFSEFI